MDEKKGKGSGTMVIVHGKENIETGNCRHSRGCLGAVRNIVWLEKFVLCLQEKHLNPGAAGKRGNRLLKGCTVYLPSGDCSVWAGGPSPRIENGNRVLQEAVMFT